MIPTRPGQKAVPLIEGILPKTAVTLRRSRASENTRSAGMIQCWIHEGQMIAGATLFIGVDGLVS